MASNKSLQRPELPLNDSSLLLPAYRSRDDEDDLMTIFESESTYPLDEKSVLEDARYASLRNWIKKTVYILINIAASVGIIFYNKHALADSQLSKMPLTIVAVHSFCTSGVMYLASRKPFALFQPVQTPIKSLLSLSLMFVVYVVLGLLSVSTNPVVIYQLGKVMNAPVVVLCNYFLFANKVSFTTIASIIVMSSGVVATIHGGWADTTPLGLCLVVSSTCAAALYQIKIGSKHKELNLNAPQLIFQQAKLSGMLLLPLIPFIDTLVSPWNLSWSAISGLLATGLLASIVNLSQFLVIETTSALTFNVASQVKTCLVMVVAWLMAAKAPCMVDYIGVMITMSGSTWYAYIAMQERKNVSLVVVEKVGLHEKVPEYER